MNNHVKEDVSVTAEVKMIMNKIYSYEAFTIEVDQRPRSTFKRRAAAMLAEKMLENGCLIHKSEYDIRRGLDFECITVLTGQPERRLP